jgi:FkbM family methyltransferase
MQERSFIRFARRFYRSYRNGRIRIGHSLVKRSFEPFIKQRQEIQLRSGLKMALDLSKGNQAGIFWYDGDADVALTWAIRELVPAGGVFVDCGANCGLMGLLAAQHRHARAIFIEPHPRLARTIEANLQLNHFESRAELIEAAVSDSSGEVIFYESPTGDDGTHSIHADWQEEKRALGKVRCRTLEEIIGERQLPLIDFLKIDTEGNDFPVLKSLGDYRRPSFARLIHVEMTRNAEAIFKLMTDSGYVGFTTRNQRGRQLALKFQAYERGSQVSFFHPLETASDCGHNALWCGKDSAVAGYLKNLDHIDQG